VPAPESREWFSELLKRELGPWLSLREEQVQRLYQHYELLKLWNKKINLTSVDPGAGMVVRHYCESLFFGANFPGDPTNISVVDIGSGAGFPGLPLAVLHSDWQVSLVESNRRKATFLLETTRGMGNISVLAQRAEGVSHHFDWIVSRAVQPSEVLRNVPRLATRLGLMVGDGDFSAIKSLANIAWAEPVRLPWGDRRICVYGEVSRGTNESVLRGTSRTA
jgi:16S rRNA (guanine527-N7)-methyltransferase